MQHLALQNIKTDGGTQARAALNEDVVAEYAEAIIGGTNLPPVTVHHDGKVYWLADGFHRYFAHVKARAAEIAVTVIRGTKRDAILYSVGANNAHGLRRTNDDKRCAVKTLLRDKEWGKWSDRQIAYACGVTHPFVASIRNPKTKESAPARVVTVTTDLPQAAPQSHFLPPDISVELMGPISLDHAKPSKKTEATDPAARITELESALALITDERDEAMDTCRALAVELEAYEKASEGVEAAAKEIQLLNDKLRVAHSRCDQMMVTDRELKKQIESQSRQIKALNKKLGTSK